MATESHLDIDFCGMFNINHHKDIDINQMYNFEDKKVKKDVTSNFERAIKLRNESKVFSEKVYEG